MRVLVVEEVPGDGAAARQALVAAGHEVTSCHDNGSSFPCRGLMPEATCPLEGDGVDVALLVRSLPGSQPTAREDGVRCALRRKVPLALTGEVEGSPYLDHATVVEPDVGRAVDAAVAAATRPLAEHGEAARRALVGVLDAEGVPSDEAGAVVIRSGRHLVVTLLPGAELTPRVAETASVRVLGAVRALDPDPAVIDVTFAR
ncbi:hypothetical protein [Actinomarinicola tropica]|uniref:Uncharacterized protein n=1 Tax=Actinomarinicola tropica TaxID=2789776 RepID=A0A5Q2RI52_9ACTN|nr:hypothetical protein [Actinomarinicola tropica]QGG96469.1 hypothetical protein GH723_15925 [Actinomarinicola tropica]